MVDLFLFRTALRDLVRPRRLMAAALLVALPPLVALMWRYSTPDVFDAADVYNTLASVLVFGFLLVILAVVYGTGVITQEIEQKTIAYLLTRPVPRWRIVFVKFLAATAGILVTTSLSTSLLAAAVFGGGGEQTSALLRIADIKAPANVIARIKGDQDPVAAYLHNRMDRRVKRRLESVDLSKPIPDFMERNLVRQINDTLRDDAHFYKPERFQGVALRPETEALLKQNPTGRQRVKLNRLLLEDAFSTDITPRQAAKVSVVRDIGVLGIGAAAYAALFLLLAAVMNRPLMVGLVFAFGWETWVPNMPGKFQLVSIMTFLRVLSPHPRPPAESVDLIQFLSGMNQEAISSRAAWITLASIIAFALLLALIVFSNREYVPREDAE